MLELMNAIPNADGRYLCVQAYVDGTPCLRIATFPRQSPEGHANVLDDLLREVAITPTRREDFVHDYRFIPEPKGERYALAGVGVVRVHKGVATLEQDGIEGTASQEWRDYPRLSIDVRHVQQWQYALNRARAQRQ